MAKPAAAVAGAGFIGRVHVEALRRLGVPVVGVLGSSPDKGRAAATALGVPRAYDSYDALLADPAVGVVHLTTPNWLHFEQCRRALTAGKHVVCEKPLAMTAAETAELVRLAEQTPVVAAVCYNVRFYPLCLEARQRIAAGELGSVYHVTGSYVQDWLLYDTDFNWRVLAAEGGEVGNSMVERDRFADVLGARRRADERGVVIRLPEDAVAAPEMSVDAERRTVPAADVPPGMMGLDIGPRTVERFARTIADARTILWNGPMGVFELEPFSAGTRGVATAIAAADAFSVAGGGDSVAAVKRFGLEDGFDHLSTGGGASLEFLEGRELPGVKVLQA